ncbi:MAG: hypothetical protein ACLP05_04830 [Candidatus Kryptoniota bacterium]
MPRFKVGLSRTYSVTIEATNREDAKQAADLFIGERDLSTENHRKEFGFKIENIETMWNDAFECQEIEEAI